MGDTQEQLYGEVQPAIDGANFIVEYTREKNAYNEVGGAAGGQGAASQPTRCPEQGLDPVPAPYPQPASSLTQVA